MHPRTFWAILLIIIGLVFLLGNFGLLPGNAWNYIWPIVLIAIGIMFLLGAMNRGRSSFPVVNDSLPTEGASSARIRFHHGAGQLRVRAGDDANLLYTGSFAGGVEKKVNRRGDNLEVQLESDPAGWSAPWNWWGTSGGLNWDVALNPALPLSLEFETGASDSDIDLSGLKVGDMRFQTGASATRLTMPAAGMTRARIESGAASVKVRIPDGVAASISGEMGLGALDVDQGRFPKRGGVYESEGYASAANRIELRIEGGVGSVSVY